MSNHYKFVYDALRQGYDTSLWKTLDGTPTVSSSQLRFSEATAISYGDITKGAVTFKGVVVDEPEASDDRRWGFAQAADITNTFIGFRVSDVEFTVVCGTQALEVEWVDAWTGTPTDFKVDWRAGTVDYSINGVVVATLSNDMTDGSEKYVPVGPLSVYIDNQVSDNMDFGNIIVDTQQYI